MYNFPEVPDHEIDGVYSPLQAFEVWMINNDYKPVTNSKLNAYCSGKIMVGSKVGYYGRTYIKNDKRIMILFGIDNYNFYVKYNDLDYPIPTKNYDHFINNPETYEPIEGKTITVQIIK